MPSSRRSHLLAFVLLSSLGFLCAASAPARADCRLGETWPGGGDTYTIAVDPSNRSTLYVGTLTRLYKSIDARESWHEASVSETTKDEGGIYKAKKK
jgi:hypothetical protein